MPRECRSLAALVDIPESDCLVITATGECTPIGTPDDSINLVHLSLKCVEQPSTGSSSVVPCLQIPQLDLPILPAPAHEGPAVRSKSQTYHRTCIPTD